MTLRKKKKNIVPKNEIHESEENIITRKIKKKKNGNRATNDAKSRLSTEKKEKEKRKVTIKRIYSTVCTFF